MLHGNGSDGAKFTDDSSGSNQTITAYNNASLDFSTVKFGDGSCAFDGTNDYLLIDDDSDLEFGANDFTIDFWFYPTAESRMGLWHSSYGADYSFGIDYHYQGTRNINIWASSNGSSWDLINADPGGNGIGSTSLTLNAWNHIAIVRNGNTWMTFINGTKDIDITVSGTVIDKSASKIIGGWWDGSYDLNGYLDEYRVSNTARWISNFTVPSSEYDNDSDTKLLLHFTSPFIDDSDSTHNVSAIGNVQLDTAQKKFGTASILYDGTEDYLSIADSDDWYFGSNNFTIDFWIRFNSIPSDDYAIVMAQKEPADYDHRLNFFFENRNSQNNTGFNFYLRDNASDIILLKEANGNASDYSTGTWYHIAVVRNGNTWTMYRDGTSVDSDTVADDYPNFASAPLTIGGEPTEGKYLDGWMDEIRIQNGEAYWTSNFTPPTQEYTETLEISVSETINLGETSTINITALSINVSETINLGESTDIYIDNSYAQQIISYNPLIYVTNQDPAQIVHIDISTPSSPVKTVYTLSGVKNARGVVLNDTNDYFYVICDEGKVVKVQKSDLSNQTTIDTSDSDTFQEVDCLDTQFKTFLSTDDSDGEIILIDESEIKKINTDLRWLKQVEEIISTRLDTIKGKKIDTDLRWIAETSKIINTDLRWIKYDYDEISLHPINRTSDWVVKINGTDMVPLNDVQMDSITITHDINTEKTKGSIATFILNRRHDKLDYDNQGTSSQITNNNAVVIEIDGQEEFSGKIFNLVCANDGETVTVTAKGSRPSDKRQTVKIPLASIGDNAHLYQCFLNSPIIDKPYLDTRQVIQGESGTYWTGSVWDGDVENALTFATYSAAESYINGVATGNTLFHDNVPEVANYDATPNYYKGITVDLGTQIEQNIMRYSSFQETSSLADEIEAGNFQTKQNWIYFWFATFVHYITNTSATTLRYLGKSLGSLSTDLWEITGASYKYQKKLDDIETDLGSYQTGSAPYRKISPKNGKKITKYQWEDKNDGLYLSKDAGYDNEQFAKDVANIEYSKLKNINGDVLPVTSADIQLTLDGYYYYGIKLLTRINITNTTTANIYNANNGFPVSVKTITINSGDMKVTLNCSNQYSQLELDEIDEDYPSEDSSEYVFEAESIRHNQKFDPNSWTYPA